MIRSVMEAKKKCISTTNGIVFSKEVEDEKKLTRDYKDI
jgi:hypothetical protein